MDIAKVRYTAFTETVHTHTTPTGGSYKFKYYTHDTHWTDVDEVEDAKYFDQHESFAVKWTPAGRIARAANGTIESAKDVLDEMGYREKQSLAKDHGIKANQKEEDLNAELQEVVEDFARDMQFQ